MLTLLSPAKSLNLGVLPNGLPTTEPCLSENIPLLLERCRQLDVASLRQLMKLSQPLAELNYQRFQEMSLPLTPENSTPCILTFAGDVYRGLDARNLLPEDLKWAQDHLRILSGFYGVLRPLDLIQPYRLEMGTPLDNPRGKNLYDFWGDRITDALNAAYGESPVGAVLNLASNEYFKSVRQEKLTPPLVTALFQEIRDGKLRTISFSAKRARGLMARFIVLNRVETPDGLTEFAEEGYGYRPDLSQPDRLLFVRE